MSIFDRFRRSTSEQKIDSKMGKEMGATGDAVFDSFDNELSRCDKIGIKDYRIMRDTDATVDSLFNIVTLPILSATFGVKASEDDINEKQAEFIRTCLFRQPYLGGMDVPFSLVLEQMLHAIIDGFEVFERVYRIDDDGKIVIKKLALRDATTVKIKVDKYGGYDGIRQEASFGDRRVDVVIPAYKTFLFTYGKADNPWYGRSAFKSCWKNYDKKQKLEYLDSISIQNSAVKPKIMYRTENTTVIGDEDRSKGLRALMNLGKLKSVASIPYGFEVKELAGGDNSTINESIERQNSEMARSFLATFSLLGSQGSSSVGSFALSADQSDLFMVALKGMMNLIVDHINQYWIADLIDLNYPVGKRYYPEFYFNDLTDDTIDFLKNIFTELVKKDKVSDEIIGGIEEQIKSRFEIEPVGREEEQGSSDGESGQNPNNVTPEDNITSGQEPDKDEGTKEDDGSNAGKFRREPTVWEEKINWDSIEKQRDKIENGFEKEATPILHKFIKKLSSTPELLYNGLPVEYIKTVRKYYGTAYNYGKMAASDEENKPAPKTKDDETEKTRAFVDFIVERQTADLKELIKGADDKNPTVQESSPSKFLEDGLEWIKQAIDGTKSAIFGNGNNAGRSAAYRIFDESEDATYMWSALMEHSCAICEALDGSVYSSKEFDSIKYQPGEVHLNCACEWVRMTGDGKPKPTGLPDNIEELDHITNTKKDDLKKEGLLKDGETKANALRREQFNNPEDSHGKNVKEFEEGARKENVEFLAIFDKNGDKIAEITSRLRDEVTIPDDFLKLLKNKQTTLISHNHPLSLPLSPADITLASMTKTDIHAISTKYDFVLTKGDGEWPDMAAFGNQDAMIEWFNDKYTQAAYDEFMMRNSGKKMDQIEITEAVQHLATTLFAKDYGLSYNRNKL